MMAANLRFAIVVIVLTLGTMEAVFEREDGVVMMIAKKGFYAGTRHLVTLSRTFLIANILIVPNIILLCTAKNAAANQAARIVGPFLIDPSTVRNAKIFFVVTARHPPFAQTANMPFALTASSPNLVGYAKMIFAMTARNPSIVRTAEVTFAMTARKTSIARNA